MRNVGLEQLGVNLEAVFMNGMEIGLFGRTNQKIQE
jgi:hypothetical protein